MFLPGTSRCSYLEVVDERGAAHGDLVGRAEVACPGRVTERLVAPREQADAGHDRLHQERLHRLGDLHPQQAGAATDCTG